MSITDELRTGGIYRFPSNRRVFTEEELTAIADRIDAEHKKACVEAWNNGVSSVPIALDESQWVQLPKDADGEPIHIGDVMENIVCPSIHREVTGVGVECFYGWDDGNGRYSQFGVNCYRHHHAPTVEDVLREFEGRLAEVGTEDMCVGTDADLAREAVRRERADVYAEFAAKLRLAGDAE